jgi:D-alanine-D-alanine ligase
VSQTGLHIGITCDLRSDYLRLGFTEEQVAEFDSDTTVEAIEQVLRELGHRPTRIGHAKALCERLVRGERWELVFNICEGMAGRSREAQVPALLELYGIAYTFSDPLVCAVTLDKAIAKRVVKSHGVRTPAFAVVETAADLDRVKLAYPLFAKPIAEGTGKGVTTRSRCDSPAELAELCRDLLRRYRQPVLVEEYLPGREFTVGILGTGSEAQVIGTMEIAVRDPENSGIYSFENKEKCDQLVRYSTPPRGPLRRAVEKLARDAYVALECRDGGRVDVRLDTRGRPSFMEVNPLAGLHPHHSDLPMIATREGMSYTELIGRIVASACRRGSGSETAPA